MQCEQYKMGLLRLQQPCFCTLPEKEIIRMVYSPYFFFTIGIVNIIIYYVCKSN